MTDDALRKFMISGEHAGDGWIHRTSQERFGRDVADLADDELVELEQLMHAAAGRKRVEAAAVRQLLIKNADNPWVRGVLQTVRKSRVEDLTMDELLEVRDEALAASARSDRKQAVGADFKARMSSMGCGCPVLYDNDSRGIRIQSSAKVEHLSTCELKSIMHKPFPVESE